MFITSVSCQISAMWVVPAIQLNTVMLVCVCIVVACVGAHAQIPAVDTEQGKIIGVNDNNYMSFYDIPYGGPTSGENRFKPPLPAPAFKEEFIATNRNITCAQPTPKGIIGTEDCLVLSIHTNNLTSVKPVLVWLENENYETTPAARRTFKNLVTEGLVVVSLNHRLSIFGFLCLRVAEAPGNAGLLDIVLGLTWIRKNIVGFGGDPSNIVLLGHGSGAALADILTLSPITDDSIHKAVILSGSALAPWAVSYKNIDNANAIGSKLGLSISSRSQLAKSLKKVSVEDMLIALNNLKKDKMSPLFAPCIEDAGNVLNDDPIYLLKSNNFKRIPYLTGFVKNDGTVKAHEIINGSWTEEVRYKLAEFLPTDLNIESNKTNVTNEIRNLYFTNYNNVPKENETEEAIHYIGDILQIMPIIRNVQERKAGRNLDQPGVFLFDFQYRGTNNTSSGYPEFLLYGPNHGDIINYILDFGLMHGNDTDLTKYATKSIQRRFITFAYFGLPEPEMDLYRTSWLPATESYFHYFFIMGSVYTHYGESQLSYPYREATNLWDNIYSRYYRPLRSSACGLSYRVILFVCYMVCLLVQINEM